MKTLLIALSCAFLFGGTSLAKDETSVSPETVLLEGLKLIRDNKFGEWFKHCSTEKLCMNANSKKSLETYNLPAIHRRASKAPGEPGSFFKADGTIKIARVDEISADEKKLFVESEGGMPYPFRMVREGSKWLFAGI